ncbi:hypothetical protein PCH_Pc12g00280 [Penicillium rubens Wisconsin 54-1255]|uniref:Uncharacterized protein n=1 Tax=Penicillium rubens (strain ATCC 28089 / DSM 1075 / NRRL 1951 / Wisconsin 54-1255) TaxID=500485 RepID=B6GXA0_PENRW|nr:hypothetical protein PCH_Pc12g00280 [Penicillium rubens Wisconsin 54-1255]
MLPIFIPHHRRLGIEPNKRVTPTAVIGFPTSIQDSQMTCALPTAYDESENVQYMSMHIKLARIVGHIPDYFLLRRLDGHRIPGEQRDDPTPLQLRPLLEVPLQSAKSILRALSVLHEQPHSDPSLVEDMQHYVTNVTRVLSDMAAKGNAMARLRE